MAEDNPEETPLEIEELKDNEEIEDLQLTNPVEENDNASVITQDDDGKQNVESTDVTSLIENGSQVNTDIDTPADENLEVSFEETDKESAIYGDEVAEEAEAEEAVETETEVEAEVEAEEAEEAVEAEVEAEEAAEAETVTETEAEAETDAEAETEAEVEKVEEEKVEKIEEAEKIEEVEKIEDVKELNEADQLEPIKESLTELNEENKIDGDTTSKITSVTTQKSILASESGKSSGSIKTGSSDDDESIEKGTELEDETKINQTDVGPVRPSINREELLNKYEEIEIKYIPVKMRNNYLHLKLAEYFKKRKMEHVLRESDDTFDTQRKYKKNLESYGLLKSNVENRKNMVTEELNEMKANVTEQEDDFWKIFEEMQRFIKTTGTGLILKKTGKEIPEKLVDRFVKRQASKNKEICFIRLAYIKARDRAQELDQLLHNLDKLGPNLYLGEYERLKSENRRFKDKIEDKDADLTKIRLRSLEAIQILAHIREKSFCIAADLMANEQKLRDIELEVLEVRERVNYFKQVRDKYRTQALSMQNASGLLTKPMLLMDMEKLKKEYTISSAELEKLRNRNLNLKKKLNAIQNNLSISLAQMEGSLMED